MTAPSANNVKVGDQLPSLTTGRISRSMIANYAAGSGDLNPIHTDIDFARDKANLPDVIVHGMFSMGYLGRLVAEWAGIEQVRSVETRFATVVNVYDELTCTGEIKTVEREGDTAIVTVTLAAVNQDGATVSSGDAIVALDA